MRVDSIETFRPLNNLVLLKVEKDNSKLKSGIIIDTTYNESEHANRMLRVIKVPSIFTKLSTNEWETEIEIKENDVVWVNPRYISKAHLSKTTTIECNGEEYFLVEYRHIYLAKREDKLIPVNGYVVVEPVDRKIESSLYLPEELKKLKNENLGIVVEAGKPNKSYKIKTYMDDPSINNGDSVIINPSAALYLEYEIHRQLEKNYYIVQNRNIRAVYTGKIKVKDKEVKKMEFKGIEFVD